jgi:hypothetical protein
MSTRSFVSPGDVESGRRVLVWARRYLMREHHGVNRPYAPQTVCPFVEASVRANCFYMVFENDFDGRDPRAIAERIFEYVDPFKRAPPLAENEKLLKALLIVFPNIEERYLKMLDACQKIVKPRMVEAGMMVGQFHHKCEERAIHNREWHAISLSPIPLIAIRHMSIHDIIFLEDDADWFRIYDAHFGFRFSEQGKSLTAYQKHLFTYYDRAKSKHSKR